MFLSPDSLLCSEVLQLTAQAGRDRQALSVGCCAQREYWRKQLKDAPHVPHIPMPSDFDRPITDESLGEEIKLSVPANLVQSLKSLAIACGC